MFSRGMLFALASAMIVRSRGFMSGSPPPVRAATANSLMRRVKILPRLASAAPFLCLMECHLECPDMSETLPLFGQDDPDIRALVPRLSAVVAKHGFDAKTGTLEPIAHLLDGEGTETQCETMASLIPPPPLDVFLLERRQPAAAILLHRLDEGQVRPLASAAPQLHFVVVLPPVRDIGHQIDAERRASRKDARDRFERLRQIAFAGQRLEHAIRR